MHPHTAHRDCPPSATIRGTQIDFEYTLAETDCSRNLVYRSAAGERWVLKISRLPGILTWLLWPLVVYMSRREYRIYRELDGIDGIPEAGPSLGLRAYFHRYVEGHTLARHPRTQSLAPGFFDRLEACVGQVHARGVFHADLDKKGNVIVGRDGAPYLIDFQASVRFGAGALDRPGLSGRLFRALAGEDLRHLYKHKRHFQPGTLSAEQAAMARRGPVAEAWHQCMVRPLRKLRKLLRRVGNYIPGRRRNPRPVDYRSTEGTPETR